MTFQPIINGIIHVTGEHDTGKTTFALECGADPSRICFFDMDVKGRATVEQLIQDGVKFGAYHDLTELSEDGTELDFFAGVVGLIDSIKKGQFDAIIFDTWGRFGKCFHPYVLAHPSKFRKKWSPQGKIKGAEQWQEAQQYEARVLNRLGKLAPLVVVVSHLKDHYLNAAKTGKQIPASSRTFNRVPRFRIWLRHNPEGPVPIGLVLKRVDKKIFVEGKGLRTVSVLPRRVVPMDGHDSLWDTIRYYFENPIGNRELAEDEVPNEFEMSILNGTLTKEQQVTLALMLQAGAIEPVEEDEEEATGLELLEGEGDRKIEMEGFVSAAREDGKENPDIAKALQDEYEAGYPEIARLLGVQVGEVIKWCVK